MQDLHIKKTRTYRRITPIDIANFNINRIVTGNNTQASMATFDDAIDSHKDRGYHIAKKSEQASIVELLQSKLELSSIKAASAIDSLIDSDKEDISLRASMYTIDQIKGKAVQNNRNTNLNINVQSVLD